MSLLNPIAWRKFKHAVPPEGQRKIRSVEVDLPGCSFNPEEEQHQDALAEAVAAEMTKVYAKEHLPLPNRRFNHLPPPDELTALLVRPLQSKTFSGLEA